MTKYIVAGACFLFLFLSPRLLLCEEIQYRSGERRDPFIPLFGPGSVVKYEGKISNLSVEGIIYDPEGGSVVLISGTSYKEGDEVNGAYVISILPDRVILQQKDEEKVLWMREEIANAQPSKGKES